MEDTRVKYRIRTENGPYGLRYYPQKLVEPSISILWGRAVPNRWVDCGISAFFSTEQEARAYIDREKEANKIIDVD